MSIVNTSAPPAKVLSAQYLARNDGMTDGWHMGAIVGALNMIASRRFHVLAEFMTALTAPAASSSCFARIHTSPNVRQVDAIVICAKSVSNTVAGSYQWTVAGTPLNRRYIGGAVGSAVGPHELVVDRQTLISGSTIGDTVYDLVLASDVNVQIFAVIVYEVPRSNLDTSLDTAIAPEVFRAGAPILDRDIAALTDAFWKVYRRQGPPIFCATGGLLAGVELGSTTSTAFTNVLDGAAAGWTANSAGFWSIPKNKGRLATPGVECVFWIRAAITAGAGTGSVRLVSSAGTLVTITGVTGAVATYTGTCTLDTTHDTDLLILEHAISVGGTTMKVFSAGLYEFKT